MSTNVFHSRFSGAEWYSEESSDIGIGGAGGIGSWLSIMLSRASNSRLHIYDFDIVEDVNLSGQLFTSENVGEKKVTAVQENIKLFSPTSVVRTYGKFDKDSYSFPVVFSAFDNMAARKVFFEKWAAQPDREVFIDGRLLAEQIQVFCVTPDREEEYRKHLFDDKEVESVQCSMKQTSHFAALIAGRMVHFYTHHLANLKEANARPLPFYYEEMGEVFFQNVTEMEEVV